MQGLSNNRVNVHVIKDGVIILAFTALPDLATPSSTNTVRNFWLTSPVLGMAERRHCYPLSHSSLPARSPVCSWWSDHRRSTTSGCFLRFQATLVSLHFRSLPKHPEQVYKQVHYLANFSENRRLLCTVKYIVGSEDWYLPGCDAYSLVDGNWLFCCEDAFNTVSKCWQQSTTVHSLITQNVTV